MYLFFDGVSTHGYIALLDHDKNIITSETFEIQGNESTKTIPIIDNFLTRENINYSDIENIICVIGPGSFTGIRTISLVVNTIAFTYKHITLTPVNFFDLYNSYPIVKSSSKRDLFVKMDESTIIEVLSNEDFEKKCTNNEIYGDTSTGRFKTGINISSVVEYERVIKGITLQDNNTLAPLYIKKPNIT